jgi:hypothetical protein
VKKSEEEGNPTEVTRPQTTIDTTYTLGTLWPEICANHSITCTQPAEHWLSLLSNETQLPCLGSSVGIDVIVPSGVVRPEHLLEFYFHCPTLLKFAYVGCEDHLFLQD